MENSPRQLYADSGRWSRNSSPALTRSLTVGNAARSNRTPSTPSLARLYRDEKYTDMSITCRGRTFKVHKAIVCPQCPFLERACSTGYLTSQQGVIDLPEDEPNVVECMVSFMYTGHYSDGDPESEIPPPDAALARRKSSPYMSPDDPDAAYAFALSSPYHGAADDAPALHSHQNLLALQSVPPWEDQRFGLTFRSEPEPAADTPWYLGNQFNYGGHITSSEERLPLAKSVGLSRCLYLHLQVYVMAHKYGVGPLETYASNRFTKTVESRWGQLERFPEVVDELFQCTPRHDPLQVFVAETVAKNYHDVMFRSWMRPILEKHPDLTLQVLDKVVELQFKLPAR